MGTPVTLEMYGMVREARGLTSMTYNSLRYTRYWMLMSPLVFKESASCTEQSTIFSSMMSLRLYGG